MVNKLHAFHFAHSGQEFRKEKKGTVWNKAKEQIVPVISSFFSVNYGEIKQQQQQQQICAVDLTIVRDLPLGTTHLHTCTNLQIHHQ